MTQTTPFPPHAETAPFLDVPAGALGEHSTAFITGCGRSGTTILGQILSQHEHVKYLNDQFDLWIRPFPKTDIWGKRLDRASASARVALGAADADSPAAIRRFREILAIVRKDKPMVIEKLAINNFRIGFLMAIVPDAYLINIARHGVEVAFSIAAKADAGLWYGTNNRKWELLIEHAMLHGYGGLLKHVHTNYERGLLEWRMSVECAERHLAENPPARLLRVRYEELIADAGEVCDRLVGFLGLPASETMRRYAVEGVKRQSPGATGREVPRSTEAIAGETLRRLGYTF